jgi:hypothetical protein
VIRQLGESAIPYPHRHFLELELQADREELGNFDFSADDLRGLEDLYSTPAHRLLKLSGGHRRDIETAIAFAPLILAANFISKEGHMLQFIREGGAGMYVILFIAALMIYREVQNGFRLLVVKDHSSANLRLDTSSVLLGCGALLTFGIGMSALGIYVSFNATNGVSPEFLIGAKESLTPLILASLLSAVVVFAHYAVRRILTIWYAPVA